MNIDIKGRSISIELKNKSDKAAEIRVYSQRNNHIPSIWDTSPEDPDAQKKKIESHNRTILYPVIDIELQDDMKGVMELTKGTGIGYYLMNPHYYQKRHNLAETNIIDRQELEQWENWFFYNDTLRRAKSFYLTINVESKSIVELKTLSDSFLGRIELWEAGGESPLETAQVSMDGKNQNASNCGMTREGLIKSLDAMLGYFFRQQDTNPKSPMYKGLNLFYDYDAKTYRQKNWTWTWGPVIKALVHSKDIPEITDKYGKDKLMKLAAELTELSISYQVTDEKHPAWGMTKCRYDHSFANKMGYEGKFSPADGLFLAGWGWSEMYRETGDKKYLKACELITKGTGKLLKLGDIIQQDYFEVDELWKDFIMNESGFGMEGLADTYLLTRNPEYFEIAKEYAQQLVNVLGRPDGMWNRNYFQHNAEIQPNDYATRGMGWAMECLTRAYEIGLGEKYLELSIKMAEHLLNYQHSSGCWSFQFNQPIDSKGISEKGTALWSVLLYRLYSYTKNERYLNAARKALGWCLANQYFGEDLDGVGGLVSCTPASGIVYRYYYHMSCTYAVGFFALAVLEELNIMDNQGS